MVMGDVATGTDMLVIGGGPGGYTAAIRASQLSLDTTLVEQNAYGGTCLNHGCIPSKAFITATDTAYAASNAEIMGVEAEPEIDPVAMAEWKDEVVDQLTGGIEQICEANGVNLIEGTATFKDEQTARIAHGGSGQGMETVEFDRAVVATGSRPISLPKFDFEDDPVWSSKDALATDAVPDELVVIGAGYIGMELSTVFAKAGTNVTVIEMFDSVLPAYEDDLATVVRTRAEDLGIEFNFGEGATDWEGTDGDITVTTEAEDGTRSTYETEKVLVAVGREPVIDTLDLNVIGLKPNDDGFLQTDNQARTDVDHVFAVGDVAGKPMLAHKASTEGVVAAEVAAGEPAVLDYQCVPAAVFTDPEVATVGMTEAEAADAGFDPIIGKMPLRANGRSLTLDNEDGFVRIVADDDMGFVLGAQIVGPEASELIAELALAIEMGATLKDIARTVHTHPTLSETSMEAAEHACGQAIHTFNR